MGTCRPAVPEPFGGFAGRLSGLDPEKTGRLMISPAGWNMRARRGNGAFVF